MHCTVEMRGEKPRTQARMLLLRWGRHLFRLFRPMSHSLGA